MSESDWQNATGWLADQMHREWQAQRDRKGFRPARFVPPVWAKQAIDALGKDDIESFKYIRIKVTLGETVFGEVT